MPSNKDEMEFSTAERIVQEVIRQQRGLTKLHEVLEAAVRAHKELRSLPGEIKGLEKERDGLKTEVSSLKVKVKTAGDEWNEKTETARQAHTTFVAEAIKKERGLNKKYKTQELSLETGHTARMKKNDGELKDVERDLSILVAERDRVQGQLNELTDALEVVLQQFSKTG